jgi:hypothetical protein
LIGSAWGVFCVARPHSNHVLCRITSGTLPSVVEMWVIGNLSGHWLSEACRNERLCTWQAASATQANFRGSDGRPVVAGCGASLDTRTRPSRQVASWVVFRPGPCWSAKTFLLRNVLCSGYFVNRSALSVGNNLTSRQPPGLHSMGPGREAGADYGRPITSRMA